MTSESAYVPVAPSPRLKSTYTTAPAELVRLRVQHLLPQTTQRARVRVNKLKKLFTVPTAVLLRDHAAAQATTLQRLRLVKSVRNIKVQSSGNDSDGTARVSGALCLPFQSCAASPLLTSSRPQTSLEGKDVGPLPCILTGSVDGLLTLWDAEQCTPLCSQSTYLQRRGWGRVTSIAVYPSTTTAAAASQCFAFTASMFQREVRVWRITTTATTPQEAEEEAEAKEARNEDAASVSLQPLTTAGIDDASPSSTALGGLQQVAVDPTGALLAATHRSGLVYVWDARSVVEAPAPAGSASPLQRLYAQDGYETAGATVGLAFHPDGSLLTTSDAGGRVVAWDTRSGQLAFHTGGRVGGHLRAAPCVAWSPCGVRLASGGADGVVHVYDARKLCKAGLAAHNDATKGAAPFQLLGHDDTVTSLSFYANPFHSTVLDGPSVLPLGLVTTSLDHTMRVWDADTGLCVRTLDAGMPLYGHCRPALQPLSDRFAAATAIVAVGHGKSWLQYDVGLRGEVADGDGVDNNAAKPVEVTETDLVASAHGAAGSMKFSVVNAATTAALKSGLMVNNNNEEENGCEDEEEEEDEMMALVKPKAMPVAPSPTTANSSRANAQKEDSDADEESSEDEMEMLKKK